MSLRNDRDVYADGTPETQRPSNVPLAVALGALAAVGACLALQQLLGRRLTAPERARLRFYRYLHERGRLES